MNEKLRLLCYALSFLAFVAAAITNRRPTPRAATIELIAAGLALAVLVLAVDAYKAL